MKPSQQVIPILKETLNRALKAFANDSVGCCSKVIFSSRWLLAPIYMGLSAVLVIYGYKFFRKLYYLFDQLSTFSDKDLTLEVLHLLDIVMLANLTIMITIGSYTLFIRRLTIRDSRDRLSWLDHIDAGALKVKLGMALIGVSSIHLLEAFIKADELAMETFLKMTGIHLVFVVSTLVIAWISIAKYGNHSGLDDDDHDPRH
ncbi:MAG: TIGR00645 family protein [Cyanobacteriota/Melainabacteria group bacterium]|nr:TIGR00645 family protein [Candidatus Obscuribacterales bacterium]